MPVHTFQKTCHIITPKAVSKHSLLLLLLLLLFKVYLVKEYVPLYYVFKQLIIIAITN